MDAVRLALQRGAAGPGASSSKVTIDAVCGDFVGIVQWAHSLTHMTSLFARLEANLNNVDINESLKNLDRVYRNSDKLIGRLQAPPYELRAAPLINPLLLLHQRVCLAVRELLLVRARAAPKIPPEVWACVIGFALSIKSNGERVPLCRRYGFVADGSLRVVLDPPIVLPRMESFRSGLGSVMGAVTNAADPQEVAAEAVTLMGDPRHRNQTERVSALLNSFSLPLPEHMLASPRLALSLAVDAAGRVRTALKFRNGWVVP